MGKVSDSCDLCLYLADAMEPARLFYGGPKCKFGLQLNAFVLRKAQSQDWCR